MPEYSIFDGHNDTLLRFYQNDDVEYRDFLREMDSGHIDIVRARRGGFAGGFFAVYVPNPGKSQDRARQHARYQQTLCAARS